MEIDWANDVVEFRVSGPLTPMVIVDGYALLSASPQNYALRGILWDLRSADTTGLGAAALAAGLRGNQLSETIVAKLRIAAVTEVKQESGDQGLLQQWIDVGKLQDSADRRVFSCLYEAREWINQNPAGKQISVAASACC